MADTQHRTITAVRDAGPEQIPPHDEPLWFIEHDVEGGVPWVYIVPHCTFGWRAAEYGIDPNDFDTLLDVVIHEHHMQMSHADPTFLYNTDEKTARKAHLARVAEVRGRVVHHDPGGLLDTIRRAYDPADPANDTRRQHVQAIRSGQGARGRTR